MRGRRSVEVLLAAMLAVPLTWGQGGRGRGNAAQQSGTQQAAPQTATPAAAAAGNAAGRGGRGGRGGGEAAAPSEFYNYDTNAGSGPAIPDAPPVETHQKVTFNGQALAYTTRAGFLSLHNATTGQSEAHLFYTSYAKDGVSDTARPLVFFLGGAPGVAAAWQEFGGLGPKRMKPAGDGRPESAWVENPNTLLGQADLVFVNPVGTAFSRPDQPGRGR